MAVETASEHGVPRELPRAFHVGEFAQYANEKTKILVTVTEIKVPDKMPENALPPITELLKQSPPVSASQGQHHHGYDVAPAPPRNQQWPEAQSLAPGPPRHSGHPSQYSSESTVSSDHSHRRGSYTSSPSSAMTSARQSPVLPPFPGYPSSQAGAPLDASRDNRLPPMHPGADPRYPHPGGSMSPPRAQAYPPPGYDNRQEYTGPYGQRSPYPGQSSGPPPYGLSIEQHQADYGDGKAGRKRRGNLPKPVTDVLRGWFQDHVAHPYPTEEEKQLLMSQTGLSLSQISNWFINARRRSLPQMHKQAQAETTIKDSQRQPQSN